MRIPFNKRLATFPSPAGMSLTFFTVYEILKVLTNEKRGGLTVVSFDRSPFKLFSL